ncbi:chloride channel protein [uncultured Lactobacillus sp.]|uniref:chloride channel protein n=1 Tax=uncultured Lactobacillus sp. TaxID=153152 RepID=UPI002633333D|nr:chloride channel protein [uncultured Lactobacillus sp.]
MAKEISYFSLTIIGILGAALVFKLFPEEGVFGIHHRIINWQWLNLLTAIPALIVGIIFSYFFIHLENWFAIIINVKIGKVGQAGIFGILLAVASLISTDILFSGEFRIVAFTKQAFELPAGLLIIIAIVKAIMTNLGFVMGWRGGTIFPAIFSSLAIGVACAKFLPGNPRINAVIALTASLTMILGKPLLTIILLGLLVSIELTPVLIITSLLVNFLQKKYFEKKL